MSSHQVALMSTQARSPARVLSVMVVLLLAGIATWMLAADQTPSLRSTPAGQAAAPRPLGVSGSWTLRFDDEFNGARLDTRMWQPNWLGTSHKMITAPPNSHDINCVAPQQVSVRGGVLILAATRRTCRASNGVMYRYASGLVSTHRSFTFTFGYLEARVYIPSRRGHPVNFPAFWADGTGRWPLTGELDVMEVLRTCGPGLGYHFHSAAGGPGGCVALRNPGGWHTVGAHWQPGVVTYYYDGRTAGRITTGITSSPMYLILDNSVDPTLGGQSAGGSRLRVDYVRVWQSRHP